MQKWHIRTILCCNRPAGRHDLSLSNQDLPSDQIENVTGTRLPVFSPVLESSRENILKVLIIWMTLLSVPLQGFAAATMSLCAPLPAATQHDHDHEAMADDTGAPGAHMHDEQAGPDMHADHAPSAHHHSGKCAACSACCSCVSMAPSFVTVLPVAAVSSAIVPFDQHQLLSVYLALPERPPRA